MLTMKLPLLSAILVVVDDEIQATINGRGVVQLAADEERPEGRPFESLM